MHRVAAGMVLFALACGPGPGPIDGGADLDVGADAAQADVDAARAYCDPMPTTGMPCAPADLPAGFVCRLHECASTCQTTCRCESGTWQCGPDCRDYDRDGGVEPACGTPPLCRASCL